MRSRIGYIVIIGVSFSVYAMEQHRQVGSRRRSVPTILNRIPPPNLSPELQQVPSDPQPDIVSIDVDQAKQKIAQALMHAHEGQDNDHSRCCWGCLCGCCSGLVVASSIAAVYEAIIGQPAEDSYKRNLALLSSMYGAVVGVGAIDSIAKSRKDYFAQKYTKDAEEILRSCQTPACQIRQRPHVRNGSRSY